MPICIGPSASAVYVAPTLTLNASTNYNQNSGVLNAVVDTTGNKPITSVEFQWSTSSDFSTGNSAWTAASTNTTISQGTTNTARSVTATNLTENASTGTPYYVRARATNAAGFVVTTSISSSTSNGRFTTYKKNTPTFTSSTTWTNPVPTSGTSGLAITSGTATVWGAGAGSEFFGGGGGGGGRNIATASVGSSVTVTVGAGGASQGNGNTSSFGSVSASGGYTGVGSTGGASGNGNPGGIGRDEFWFGGGGGGGAGGAGGNAVNSSCGGGAAGASLDGRGRGCGGYGVASDAVSACYTSPAPAYANANSSDAGTIGGGSGYVSFEYWGP